MREEKRSEGVQEEKVTGDDGRRVFADSFLKIMITTSAHTPLSIYSIYVRQGFA